MKRRVLVVVIALAICFIRAPAEADSIMYKFADATTASFLIDTDLLGDPRPHPFTINMAGTFVVDAPAQVVTAIDVTLSGFPSFFSSWNAHYPTILSSFWASQQFLAVNDDGTNGFQPHFLTSGDGISFDPLISVGLDTSEFGRINSVSVNGGVNPVPSPIVGAGLPSLAMFLAAVLIRWRLRTGPSRYAYPTKYIRRQNHQLARRFRARLRFSNGERLAPASTQKTT